ncbi:MAG: hypothetical protein K0S11_293 [Gammaproteobacteria bacterium]|jgi:hypothetical protein|nr:hypothetical protein [Gammaproteobacteria bacterium]
MTEAEKLKKLKAAAQLLLDKKDALATLYGPDAEFVFKYAPDFAKALGSLAGPLQNLMRTMREIE